MTWDFWNSDFWKNYWWAVVLLAALVLLFVVLIVIGRRKNRAGEFVVNLAVPVVVIGLLVVGVISYETSVPDADEDSCSIETPADNGQAVLNKKQELREKLQTKKDEWTDARQIQRTDPSPEHLQDVNQAAAKMKVVAEELGRWRGVSITIDEDAITDFKVGHDVSSGVRTIGFTTETPVPGPVYLPIDARTFDLAGSSRELDPDMIRSTAKLDKDGAGGTIRFCLVSSSRLDALSGDYSGMLVIQQGRVNRTEVPVTVALGYPRTEMVMLAGLGIALVSSWYVYFLRRPGLPASILLGRPASANAAAQLAETEASARVLRWKFGFWQGYWRWISSATGAVTIVAGTIGAVTAFTTAYLASDTWSGSFKDWFAFSGAVATAFIAAGTAGRLAGQEFDKPLKPGD